MSGREFPGFKLVSGRSIRRFYDQAEGEKYIISKLGARAYKPKEVVSLAMAEKLDKTLKKDEKWQELVYKPEGAPKLVQEHEAGKPIAYGVQGMMNDIASGKLT